MEKGNQVELLLHSPLSDSDLSSVFHSIFALLYESLTHGAQNAYFVSFSWWYHFVSRYFALLYIIVALIYVIFTLVRYPKCKTQGNHVKFHEETCDAYVQLSTQITSDHAAIATSINEGCFPHSASILTPLLFVTVRVIPSLTESCLGAVLFFMLLEDV